jgi:hypothetical protein
MDNLGFKNLVEWKRYDSNGNLVHSGQSYNTTQDNFIQGICDLLYNDGAINCSLAGIAIGTGTGQNAAADALSAKVSDEALSAAELTDNGTNVVAEVTFTNRSGGSWSIEEAGMGGVADVTSDMLFYNDTISESLGDGDTLTITWTVTPADV